MNKSLLIRSITLGFIAGVTLYGIVAPQTINADLKNSSNDLSSATLVKNNHLTMCKLDKSSLEVVRTVKMVITAYNSLPNQTDDTPFITASGKHVADGIIANNMLPFGTKVKIEGFGDKIFTVQDRMHQRMGNYHADIWMTSYKDARAWGAKVRDIYVVES